MFDACSNQPQIYAEYYNIFTMILQLTRHPDSSVCGSEIKTKQTINTHENN